MRSRSPQSLIHFKNALTKWGLPTFLEAPACADGKVWWWILTAGPQWGKSTVLRYSPQHARIDFLWFSLPAKGCGVGAALRTALKHPRYATYLQTLQHLATLQQGVFGRQTKRRPVRAA